MNKYADLHIHTSASDGEFSPREAVKMYKKHGFSAIAITDHDTLEGLYEAVNTGKLYDLEIIPGVEISTVWENEEIHILGYFVDSDNYILQSKLTEMKNAREIRVKKMLARLNELGYQITWSEVNKVAGKGSLGRPHLAKVLLEKGYIKTIKEAFHKLLGWGCPAFIPRYKITPQEAILIIKKAEGIPIVAHPGLNLKDDLLNEIYEYCQIEIPKIYDLVTRTGCMGCPYGSWKGDTVKELELVTDNQYKFLWEYFGESYKVLKIPHYRQLTLF